MRALSDGALIGLSEGLDRRFRAMPVGFRRLALLWRPAGIVMQAVVRFLPAKWASSEPGMKVAAVLMSARSLAVLARTACCCLLRLGYRASA